jgi:DNA-binding HxlR family transcriptional regulator
LFRKGTPEVILFLASVEKARYSDIRKQRYVVGDRSLSRILKELQKQALISRETLPTYPVSTTYSLTDKGKLVAKHLNILKETL